MSWKKNAFSYLMWFIYALITCGILKSAVGVFCIGRNIEVYWGVLFTVIVFLAVGGTVLLIHFCGEKVFAFIGSNRTVFHVLEAVLAIGLIIAGIIVRVQGMEGAEETSAYYEAAKVASGQRIPQIVHGAIFLYVNMLHLVFILLGNYFAAAIGLQIFLQMAALLILFFTVRRLFGSVAALVMLGFGTCASYMVRSALVLSPEALFLLIMAVSATLVTGEAFWKENRKPLLFLPAGMLSALCAYIDVGGSILLILIIAVILCSCSLSGDGRQKLRALFFAFWGALIGFFILICMDAFLSGNSFEGVLEAWIRLYRPENFHLPTVADAAGSWEESIVLLMLMVIGVFSFWFDRAKERITVCLIAAGIVMAAECYGIFTEEMPGYLYLYLLFVLIAGIGLGQCFKLSISDRKRAEDVKTGVSAVPEALESSGNEGSGELEILEVFERGKQGTGENPEVAKAFGGEKSEVAGPIREDGKMEEHRNLNESSTVESPVKKQVKYIENPLPLPKKHQKRVMDYPVRPARGNDDYDYPVSEDDDFDI